jgi:hypothetical protein
MAKRATIAFIAVLIVAAIPVGRYLLKPREVISATPSSNTGATAPLPMAPRGVVCSDGVLFDTDSQVARFGAVAPRNAAAPALEVVARGDTSGPYRNGYVFRATVPGGWRGTRTLNVDLQPPRRAAFGTLCIRNASDQAMTLVGSQQGRAGARPSVTVNGQLTPIELPLRLLEHDRRSLVARTGQILGHASTLRPFGAWWWWVLALAALTLAPAGVAVAMRSALAADD